MADTLEVIFQCECTSTHHKLAIDALRHLQSAHATAWRNLFLRHFDAYLDGAKAPDKKFKDFRNHVLHVGENYWGGAVETAKTWYAETVTMLSRKQWRKAIYAAGVLSHYYTDPIQPMHTGQSEQEGVVHRAMEWSITKSYDQLRLLLMNQLGGYPDVEAPQADDWLEQMVVAGAEIAHPHYQMLIDHYDLNVGRKDPPAGLDDPSRECLARLLGHASVGFARILDRAFDEAAVTPPGGGASLVGYLARLTTPISWTLRRINDRASRKIVKAIYDEVQAKGKAIDSLPADDKLIRKLHADEVLQVPLSELDAQPIEPTGSKHVARQGADAAEAESGSKRNRRKESRKEKRERVRPAVIRNPKTEKHSDSARDAKLRFHLSVSDPVVDAPSIGPKTAKRLGTIGVRTVADLLELDADEAAEKINRSYIDAETIRRWQREATLACRIPNIRGHDAQLLVGCDLTDPDEIGLFEANELLDVVLPFATSDDGKRILRNMSSPSLDEVTNWIAWSGESRELDAA